MPRQIYYGKTTTLKFDDNQLYTIGVEIENLANAMEDEHGIHDEDEQDELEMLRALKGRIDAARRRLGWQG